MTDSITRETLDRTHGECPTRSSFESGIYLFSHEVQSPTSSSCPYKYDACIPIQRLLISLEYFTNDDETNRHELFNEFMDNIYKHRVYDDFYHLTKYHKHELEHITQFVTESNKFTECDLSFCNFANRHFGVDNAGSDDSNITNMQYNDIYFETMDSLHYYVFHLVETGMRQRIQSDINDEQEEKEANQSSSQHFDLSFKNLCDSTIKCKNKTRRFPRISGNKFNISVVDSEVKSDDTFLDAIYEEISSKNNHGLVFLLKQIIESNGYDTDSLDIDLEIFISDEKSNLSELLSNHKGIHNKVTKLLQKYRSYVFYVQTFVCLLSQSPHLLILILMIAQWMPVPFLLVLIGSINQRINMVKGYLENIWSRRVIKT